jgi:hypothetical protein
MAALRPAAWIGGGALVLWLVVGHGFANYDSLYTLVWGQQLSRGELPDYELPIAPTPHPLANLIALALAPLGPGTAEAMTVALAFVALAAVGYLVYRLGELWFGPAVGLLAAALILTREPVLSYGVRTYVDVPYIALVLAALVVESRRPRAGAPVLALLALAGLLRPEAWLFTLAYLAWLWRDPARRDPRLVALAAAGPVLWALSDLLVTGNPLFSLTQTRDTAETLGRVTGIDNVPTTMPRRLGEILREPGLLGAAGGGAVALLWLRDRARLGLAAAVVALAAFCVLAVAGLPIITRYLLLPAAILAVFCGVGAFGWLALGRDDSRRRPWLALGVVVLLVLAVFAPSQYDRLRDTRRAIATQEQIRDDLVALVDDGTIEASCGPVAVPNHRPVPLLALRLEIPPSQVVSAQVRRTTSGTYVDATNARVARSFVLDKRDPHPLTAEVPRGFRPAGGNRSWRVFKRCG